MPYPQPRPRPRNDEPPPPVLAALAQVVRPERGEFDQVAERVFDDRGVLRAERVTTHARIGPEPVHLHPAGSHARHNAIGLTQGRSWVATVFRMAGALALAFWVGATLLGRLVDWLLTALRT